MDIVWFAVVMIVGVYAAVRASRAFDRAFEQLGSDSAGPRPYPDQDPAP